MCHGVFCNVGREFYIEFWLIFVFQCLNIYIHLNLANFILHPLFVGMFTAPSRSPHLPCPKQQGAAVKTPPSPSSCTRQHAPIVTSLGTADLPRLSIEHEFNGRLHQTSQSAWKFLGMGSGRGFKIERGIKWYDAIRPDTALQGRETCSAT